MAVIIDFCRILALIPAIAWCCVRFPHILVIRANKEWANSHNKRAGMVSLAALYLCVSFHANVRLCELALYRTLDNQLLFNHSSKLVFGMRSCFPILILRKHFLLIRMYAVACNGTRGRIRTSGLPLRSRPVTLLISCHHYLKTLDITGFFQISLPVSCHHFLLISVIFGGRN